MRRGARYCRWCKARLPPRGDDRTEYRGVAAACADRQACLERQRAELRRLFAAMRI